MTAGGRQQRPPPPAPDLQAYAESRGLAPVVTAATATGMTLRINARVAKQGYRLELDPGDGGAPLVVKAWLPPGIEPGARARVVYDPASRDAVMLEIPSEQPIT